MNEKLIELLKSIKESHDVGNAYLDSVPTDIRMFITDNEYSKNMSIMQDKLIDAAFGKYSEDVFWFLYEFPYVIAKRGEAHIKVDDKEYIFNNDEDFYQYLREQK